MALDKPFGDDSYILDGLRNHLIQQLQLLAADLPPASRLLDALTRHPAADQYRLLGETTLRSAIGHAHKQITSGSPRALRLRDCAAIIETAAGYVEQGRTDTPLQDGALVPLGPKPHHGWIWREEHSDDTFGRAFRELVAEPYGMLPNTPDPASIELLASGARLLEDLLPLLAPSALRHAHVIACVPSAGVFSGVGSSSQLHLGGSFFLRQSLGSPWWIAEHLLHESLHLKLYDLHLGHTLVRSDLSKGPHVPVATPWNSSRLCGANRWYVWRVFAAFHVYVHLALFCTQAERRISDLEATYGPMSGMTGSRRAQARATYLGRHLKAVCWDKLAPAGQELTDWLNSLLDTLNPTPAPDGSTVHLYLDRYHTETDELEQTFAESAGKRNLQRFNGLAHQDLASTRAILADLEAGQQLAELDTAVAQFNGSDLGEHYPEVRRIVENCLSAVSPDGYRMSASGEHDADVAELVDRSSDQLFAIAQHIPCGVAEAKRRAVEQGVSCSCDDSVGRFLAAQAAHLSSGAKILEIGDVDGTATAWLLAGLGSRDDVDVLSLSVQIDAAQVQLPGTFDLIVADGRRLPLDDAGAVLIDGLRPGGMLIVDHFGVGAPDHRPTDKTARPNLRQVILEHPELVAAPIDWPSGVLVATSMRSSRPSSAGDPGR